MHWIHLIYWGNFQAQQFKLKIDQACIRNIKSKLKRDWDRFSFITQWLFNFKSLCKNADLIFYTIRFTAYQLI